MSAETKYWFLRNHKLFDTLNDDQVNDLCIITRFKTASKSELVYFAEEPIKRIFLLKRGKIKIVETNENGDEMIKDIIQQGDLFGELSLTKGPDNKDYAKVISPEAIICTFTLEDFERLMQNNPSVALVVYKSVGDKLKKLESKYANLVFKDVEHRLRDFIKNWANTEGVVNANGAIVIENYLTHEDIANLICSTRQTVTQLLNTFKHNGLLDYGRKEIVIPDITKI